MYSVQYTLCLYRVSTVCNKLPTLQGIYTKSPYLQGMFSVQYTLFLYKEYTVYNRLSPSIRYIQGTVQLTPLQGIPRVQYTLLLYKICKVYNTLSSSTGYVQGAISCLLYKVSTVYTKSPYLQGMFSVQYNILLYKVYTMYNTLSPSTRYVPRTNHSHPLQGMYSVQYTILLYKVYTVDTGQYTFILFIICIYSVFKEPFFCSFDLLKAFFVFSGKPRR